jgi:hypothetical protein
MRRVVGFVVETGGSIDLVGDLGQLPPLGLAAAADDREDFALDPQGDKRLVQAELIAFACSMELDQLVLPSSSTVEETASLGGRHSRPTVAVLVAEVIVGLFESLAVADDINDAVGDRLRIFRLLGGG